MLQTLYNYFVTSGFGQVTPGNLVMITIGLVFIYLAVKRGFEPLLLVPIGFGMIVGNVPYLTSQLSIGVYDGPPDPAYVDKAYLDSATLLYDGQRYIRLPSSVAFPSDKIKMNRQPDGSFPPPSVFLDVTHRHDFEEIPTAPLFDLTDPAEAGKYVHEPLNYDFGPPSATAGPDQVVGETLVVLLEQGRKLFIDARGKTLEEITAAEHPYIIPPEQFNPWNAGVLWFLYRGVKWGFFPALIFLGIGAMTDFSCLLANPKLFLLGAAAQLGIFGALLMALLLGFTPEQAASIGIIGGADGPTAIFVTAKLAPDMLGAIALAAYSYMALVPIIQPPIMRLLTTKQERLIRMNPPKHVSKNVKILFPLVGFLLTAFIAPGALGLLAMLFFGNLLKESMVTQRLANTARTALIDIVTILLGLTVGATTTASNFLTLQTVGVFVLGATAFAIATAGGVLFAKLMNFMVKEPINPLIGAAGVSAVPMAARVVQVVANKEDPHNFLLEQAMGPNVAGVIGSAVAAGVLLSRLATVT